MFPRKSSGSPTSPIRKRAAFYKSDVAEFMGFTGLTQSSELRTVARAHVIAWRKDLEARNLSPASIRRKLRASSLFDYLCERNAVVGNPVDGVKRPMANDNEGSTPALGDAQARRLLEAPAPDTLKGVRDRAILATQLYHGIRREELCLLRLRDMQSRQGVMHFRIKGKRDKIRFVPIHPLVQRLIEEYLQAGNTAGALSNRWMLPSSALWRIIAPGHWTGISIRAPSSATSSSNMARDNGGQRGSHRGVCAFDAGYSRNERAF